MNTGARTGRRDSRADWQHERGDRALCAALGAEYSPDIVFLALEESPADALDREMQERGHLLHVIEPAPESQPARTPDRLWLPALIGGGLLVAALVINAIVGGGQ